MSFASDNWSGVAPPIAKALYEASTGQASAYGTSQLDRLVEEKLQTVFETDLRVFFVPTGTAANSLALASIAKPGGMVMCHHDAHIMVDECSGPEFASGGGRLVGVDGPNGRMLKQDLQAKLDRFDPDFVHYGQPSAVSLSQLTEMGTAYRLEEIEAAATIAKGMNIPVHMDGARFANALLHENLSPAQMTWKAGIDILSFGGTKNGCWCAEAVIFFNPDLAEYANYVHKRSGYLFSKSRFIAAQYDAYLTDGLWLKLAAHANGMAHRMRIGVEQHDDFRLAWETHANENFVIMDEKKAQTLRSKGAQFYEHHISGGLDTTLETGEAVYRFVTNFSTTEKEVGSMFDH